MIKPSKQILILIGVPINKQGTRLILFWKMHIATIALNCLKILVHAKSGFGHILKIKKDHFGVAPLNDGGTT